MNRLVFWGALAALCAVVLDVLDVPVYSSAMLFILFFFVVAFIYSAVRQTARAELYREQRGYQETLRRASAGMGRIRDLDRLIRLIVFILIRAVRMEYALVYILDQGKKEFRVGALRHGRGGHRGVHGRELKNIPADSLLAKALKNTPRLIDVGELKRRAAGSADAETRALSAFFSQMNAALAFPVLINSELFAVFVLGRKAQGRVYSADDIAVFSILANQAALAVENARFYEDVKRTREQLIQAEKMSTVGTMADGLSHQINNRFHAMGFIAGDALDTLQLARKNGVPPEMNALLEDMERAFVRVEENVRQGGEIVRGLLRYTRKGEEGLSAVSLEEVFRAAWEMAQFKVKTADLRLFSHLPPDLPRVKGNFTQLQEVFFNIIDNGYDAMRQRRDELKEEGYEPSVTLSAAVNGGLVEVTVADNGIGVRSEDRAKLFTPFFTTKQQGRKGTGLGLYVIKKIIEENHGGSLVFDSEHMVGTRFVLRLPVAPLQEGNAGKT
jgi:signal transduction histidine kinase